MTNDSMRSGWQKSRAWEPGDPISPDMPIISREMEAALWADPEAWEERQRALAAGAP